MNNETHCHNCGALFADQAGEHTTGYATWLDTDTRTCFECCAYSAVLGMAWTGRATLYDCGSGGATLECSCGKDAGTRLGTLHAVGCSAYNNHVKNWPGSLDMRVTGSAEGRHNWGGKQYHRWFTAPDGSRWVGRRVGDNTQLLHCRRLKDAA